LALAFTISALYAQERQQQQQQDQVQNQRDQQDQAQPSQRPQLRREAREGAQDQAQRVAGAISDVQLVAWIGIDNNGEIQLSQLGVEKAQNEEVKKFAQQMVDEHTQLAQKLQQFGGALGERSPRIKLRLNRGNDENRQDQAADDQPQREQDQDQPAPDANRADQPQATADAQNQEGQERTARRLRIAERGHGGLLAFHADVKERCQQQAQKMFQEKQGAEFDHCFMQAQIGAHMGALATLEAAQEHAQSSELKQALEGAAQTTKQHLDHAIALFEKIDKGSAAGERQGAERQKQTQQQGEAQQPRTE
jgi:predicted outer membrane protein